MAHIKSGEEVIKNSENQNIIDINNLKFNNANEEQLLKQTIDNVLLVSPYVCEQLTNNPIFIEDLLCTSDLFNAEKHLDYSNDIIKILSDPNSNGNVNKIIRRYRNQQMIRIAWRDIAGWASIDEILYDLSILAEAFVSETFEYLFQNFCNKHGYPINRKGQIQKIVILGMGKLGAWELNFSSDIDLIFFYEEDGYFNDKKNTSYYEFYTKLIQLFIRTIDNITEDGFVYRIDTRLRPFGESGPLVMNLDGMETYYQSQAREWERYAMVKARVIAGDYDAGNRFQSIITSFVYRRYLDYRAFGELRHLKKKITQELQRKDRIDNIKLGPGGIREIEFIGQAFQLIRGGREVELRERSIIKILETIGDKGYLPIDLVNKLINSYRFLRVVENRLQQYSDMQVHDLPIDNIQKNVLSSSLGYSEWSLFKEKINEVRQNVHEIFSLVIDSPQRLDDDLSIDWLEINKTGLIKKLNEIGYIDLDSSVNIYFEFLNSYSIRHITARGSIELNKLLPLILNAILYCGNQTETLERVLKLLESVAGRNVYFTLLSENPIALSQLIKLSSASSWIVNYISKYPLLLDELLDPRTLYSPLSLESLNVELNYTLTNIDLDDFEQFLTSLRMFKNTHVLRIAAADLIGVIPIMVVSDYLTWLAEVLIKCVLEQAWIYTKNKYGLPPNSDEFMIPGFAVIAYGKMGGIELGYSSDLDLVFLYDCSSESALTDGSHQISTAQFYARVVKRMITIFTTQILSGTLYEIDLRLRPSGNSGLLVCSIEAYEKYQMEQAWIWEQQALVRARFIAGDVSLGEKFNNVRLRSLCRQRDGIALRHEVRQMRNKMRENLEIKLENHFDLKQSNGGIADIEFIVQFSVLLNAHTFPSITQFTDVVRLLDCLSDIGYLSQKETQHLKDAFCLYREQSHRTSLLEKPAIVLNFEFQEISSRVQQIWQDKIGKF